MTSTIRKVAGGITVLESLWAAYIQLQLVAVSCPAGGCPWPSPDLIHSPPMLLLDVLLLAVGILGVWGASFAYPAGAILSVVVTLVMGYASWTYAAYGYLRGESQQALVGAALGLLALTANALGSRKAAGLSEQANPMNLPVFG